MELLAAVVDFNVTFFPLHVLGLHGMPRRVYTYLPETGWSALNGLASIGAAAIAAALIVSLVNIVHSRRHGATAGDNPWDADSLEWMTTSPPPYNFAEIPVTSSRAPLWERSGLRLVSGLAMRHREVLVTTLLDAAPDHRVPSAGPSIWPFFASLVTGVGFIVSMFRAWGLPLAIGLAVPVMFGWFWPRRSAEPLRTASSPEVVT
jgi:cytochrome c oxidase subunit I+III